MKLLDFLNLSGPTAAVTLTYTIFTSQSVNVCTTGSVDGGTLW